MLSDWRALVLLLFIFCSAHWFTLYGGLLLLLMLLLMILCYGVSVSVSLIFLYSGALWKWSVSSDPSNVLLIMTGNYLFYNVHMSTWCRQNSMFILRIFLFLKTANLLIGGVITLYLWLPLMFAPLCYLIKSEKMNMFDHCFYTCTTVSSQLICCLSSWLAEVSLGWRSTEPEQKSLNC